MSQSNEELNNLIIEYPQINNLCERCKNAEVTLICSECSPFHNYCHQCDEIIHLLPSRLNHNRKNVLNSNNNSFIYQKLNKSSQNIIINNPFENDNINTINMNNISLQNRPTNQISNSNIDQNLFQEMPELSNNNINEEIQNYINNIYIS